MLPEIAVESLRFLGPRDLDKMCATSKWLEALIAFACPKFPFRRVHTVFLRTRFHQEVDTSLFIVDIDVEEKERKRLLKQSFDTFDEALLYASPYLRGTYAYLVQVSKHISRFGTARHRVNIRGTGYFANPVLHRAPASPSVGPVLGHRLCR